MPTPGYRICARPGCGFAVKHGKRRCLRCGTPVQPRAHDDARPPARTVDTSKVKLCRGWR